MKIFDTIVIGGGQAGLSMGYFLRRHKLDYLILDDQKKPGGSWQQVWDSLKLFSPVQFSSMSGWMMPAGNGEYPTKNEFLAYITEYEKRYSFPVQRPVRVINVKKEKDLFVVETDQQEFLSRTLVSATGSAKNPFIPQYPDQARFVGKQLHSSAYRTPEEFEDQKVLVIGGGNSGAQILAEVSKIAQTQWVTQEPPQFLPKEVDGRYLFEAATRKFLKKDGPENRFSLGNIVMLESVSEARNRGVLTSRMPFDAFYEEGVIWPDGTKEKFDSVIWCTGFKANLSHLRGLGVIENDRIRTKYTRSVKEPNLWLVGYGNWTGFASATIYGVGKTARHTGVEIAESLRK